MKITRTGEEIKLNQVMDVSVDVHKDVLNLFFSVEGKEYVDECRNRTEVIEKKLKACYVVALSHGRKNLRVICEPTGEYQNKLFRTARRQGHLTCFVNAESVAKFRVIETNDTGKTDTKDPRVIRTLGELNKTIRHRVLSEDHMVLRKLGRFYDENETKITSLRCRINRLLIELFCDYSFKKDFLYSASGKALIEHFSCNPYRIIEAGFDAFFSAMIKAVPRIRRESIKRLWRDSKSSALNELPKGYIEVLETHFLELMDDHRVQVERKARLVEEMITVLNRLREEDPNIPPPTPNVISEKNLARLLAETGPVGDFESWRKLLRYGGLNIRERQSGSFKGKDRITKRGAPLLRKVLSQIVFPLVRKKCLYGEYYHRKKEIEKMPGTKAMTVMMRNFLKKFYGWYKSGEAFDEKRFFNCKTEYLKAA